MSTAQTLMIEVVLELLGDKKNPWSVKVHLQDRSRQAASAHGEANLDLSAAMVTTAEGEEWKAEDFKRAFLEGNALGTGVGQAFGRLIFEKLFGSELVSKLWKEIATRCNEQRMQMVLVLPRNAAWLADLPFELLCDEVGFLFYRGHTLLRTLQGLDGSTETMQHGVAALVAWANPRDEEFIIPIPEEVLGQHERALEKAATEFGWTTLPTCRNTTKQTLSDYLENAQPPVQILSLIAHGDPRGGAVYLCNHQDKQRADPITADELGTLLGKFGIKLIFLWSCYSGSRHPIDGSVAEALIHPELGKVSAVIAAPGALNSDGTVPFFKRLLKELRTKKGNLEHALAEARHEYGMDNLQWAAPALYARPIGGQTVILPSGGTRVSLFRRLAIIMGVLVVAIAGCSALFMGENFINVKHANCARLRLRCPWYDFRWPGYQKALDLNHGNTCIAEHIPHFMMTGCSVCDDSPSSSHCIDDLYKCNIAGNPCDLEEPPSGGNNQ